MTVHWCVDLDFESCEWFCRVVETLHATSLRGDVPRQAPGAPIPGMPPAGHLGS
jgi:hypothetical protein